MGTTDEDQSKLSRTEIRKQKLAEYLAAKGRLKPHNPKPYLKSSGVPAKPSGAVQKTRTPRKEKENSVPNTTFVQKIIPQKNKASSAVLSRLPLKSNVSQRASEQARTRRQETAGGVGNSSIRQQQSKAALRTHVTTHKPDKTGPVSVSSQAQPLHRSSANARTAIVKTDPEKRRLVADSEKAVHKSQVKYPTRNAGTATSRTDTKSLISKQTTVTLKTTTTMTTTTKGTNDTNKTRTDPLKKPLNRYPLARPDKSGKTKTDAQLANKVGNKPGLNNTQRNVPVTARQRSTLLPTFPKTEPALKATGAPGAGVKKAAPQQQLRRTTCIITSKPTVQAPVPQTLPRANKTSILTRPPVQPKTPKSTLNPGTDGVRTVPLDGRSKPSVAQEERLRKLKEWRESKGITYKRPPMPVQPARRKTTALPPQGYWSTMEQEDEVHGFVCAVDQSLNDCIKLLQQGCPADHVRDVLSRVPMAQKFAKYWICQVRLMEQEGDLDVLPTFEEAVRVVREPVDELRSVVFEILKKKEAKDSSSERERDVGSDEDGENSFNMCTPKPVGALIRGEKRNSSVIKYKITATPGGKRSQQRPGNVNGQGIRFFTPVRRSVRIEKTASCYPSVLQEHDICVNSLHELLADVEGQSELTRTPETTSPLYIYRENEALREHVQIELVYDDTDASSSPEAVCTNQADFNAKQMP